MTLPDGDVPPLNDSVDVGPERLTLLQAKRTEDEVTWLRDTGYVAVRLGRMHVVIDVGLPCPPDLPAHAHADTLAVIASVDGARVLVDTGTSTYQDLSRRPYERSTAAHNTVQVEGRDSTEVWGAFRAGRRAVPYDVHVERTAAGVQVSGCHDGFARRGDHIVHRRTVEVTPDELHILDEVVGQRELDVVARFHLAPGEEVDRIDDTTVGGRGFELTSSHRFIVEPCRTARRFGELRSGQRVVTVATGPTVSIRTVLRAR